MYQELLTFAWKQYCTMVGNLPKLDFSISLTLACGENTAAALVDSLIFILAWQFNPTISKHLCDNEFIYATTLGSGQIFTSWCYRLISLYRKDCSRRFQSVNGCLCFLLYVWNIWRHYKSISPLPISPASVSAASSPASPGTILKQDMLTRSDQDVSAPTREIISSGNLTTNHFSDGLTHVLWSF